MVILLINPDFPQDRDTYLHRVGRAGRFGTKGLAINFVKPDEEPTEENGKFEEKIDKQVLMEIQEGFKIKIAELPNELDTSLYMWLIALGDLNIVSISIDLFICRLIMPIHLGNLYDFQLIDKLF